MDTTKSYIDVKIVTTDGNINIIRCNYAYGVRMYSSYTQGVFENALSLTEGWAEFIDSEQNVHAYPIDKIISVKCRFVKEPDNV